MSALRSNVDLLVAAVDLKEVQLIRQAMRAADAQGAAKSALAMPSAAAMPRPVIHPEPRIDPRPVIHPQPRIEPRPVYHPAGRIEARRASCGCGRHEVIVRPSPNELPLPPVWSKLPTVCSSPPAPKIKLARPHPDIIHKGLLLDVFI